MEQIKIEKLIKEISPYLKKFEDKGNFGIEEYNKFHQKLSDLCEMIMLLSPDKIGQYQKYFLTIDCVLADLKDSLNNRKHALEELLSDKN
jgi:hypothetical protein